MYKEYIVYNGKETFKTFAREDEAIWYAKKYDREVWEDHVTKGGLIVDSFKVWPIDEREGK